MYHYVPIIFCFVCVVSFSRVSVCVCVFVHTGHDTLCHTCTVVVLHPTLLLGTRSHGFVCMAASMPVAPCSPADHIYIVLHLSSPIHVIHTYIHRYPCTLFSPELADAMNALLSSKFVPPEVSQLHSKPRRSVLAAGVFFFPWLESKEDFWPEKSDAFPRESTSVPCDSNDFELGVWLQNHETTTFIHGLKTDAVHIYIY